MNSRAFKTLFIESVCEDQRIIEENVRNVKISSPDVSYQIFGSRSYTHGQEYVGWPAEDAIRHYLARVHAKIPHFESMEEKELNFIKVGAV